MEDKMRQSAAPVFASLIRDGGRSAMVHPDQVRAPLGGLS